MFEGIFCIVLFVVGLIFLKIAIGGAKFVWKNTSQVLGVLVGIGGAAALIAVAVTVTVFIILA